VDEDEPGKPWDLPDGVGRWGEPGKMLVIAGATAVVLLAGLLAGIAASAVYGAWSGLKEAGPRDAGEMASLQTAALAVFLLAFQAAAIVVTVSFGRRLAPYFGALLPLRSGALRPRGVLGGLAGFVVLLAVVSGIIHAVDSTALAQDTEPFAGLMQSRSWWLMLIAAAIGAPLSEELLFRGLLFGGLEVTRLGSAGAALLSSLAWASLHLQYSLPAICAIILMGLYFCWLRQRTGSLVPGMICHGLYNGMIVLALAFAPDSVLPGASG
jgi:membrane protease YdiL (CAAX protease family)